MTRHRALRDRLRVLRNYGQQEKNHHIEVGFNRRLDTLQAAILRVKLRHLDAGTRPGAASRRSARLLPDEVIKPGQPATWSRFGISTHPGRAARSRCGIPRTEGHRDRRSLPSSRPPPGRFRGLGYEAGSHPIAEAGFLVWSLPIYPELTGERARCRRAVHDFFETPRQPRGRAKTRGGLRHAVGRRRLGKSAPLMGIARVSWS